MGDVPNFQGLVKDDNLPLFDALGSEIFFLVTIQVNFDTVTLLHELSEQGMWKCFRYAN